MSSSNPYRPVETRVLDVIVETPTIRTLKLAPREPLGFRTGQFMELTVPGVGEAPFTPSSNPQTPEVLELTVMKVGRVTARIHDLAPGDTVGLRGPFGTGYPMDALVGREVLVVGGGCGFAPLRSLMYELFNRAGQFRKLVFRGGCRTPRDFLYRREIEGWSRRGDIDVLLTVDQGGDGWTGHVGLVTTILDGVDVDRTQGVAIVCGPPVMMKFATKKLLELGFPGRSIYVSMEKNMSCGLGKCGHCRIGTFYACRDGPVFRYDAIEGIPGIWE